MDTYFEVGLENAGLDFEALLQRMSLDDGDGACQEGRGGGMDMAHVLKKRALWIVVEKVRVVYRRRRMQCRHVGVLATALNFRSSLSGWKNLGNYTQQIVATRYKEKKLKRRKSRDGAFEDAQTINKQRSSWCEWFETRPPVRQGDLGHRWSWRCHLGSASTQSK